MSNLTTELQKQIEQEAKAEAKKLTCRVPMFKFGYEGGYGDAGEKYAVKWQEEKELRERYEKALREIQAKAKYGIFPHLPVETMGAQMCIEIDRYITELFTPKQTNDDTVNG